MCATTVAVNRRKKKAQRIRRMFPQQYHVYYMICNNVYSSGSSGKQEMSTTSGVPNDIEDANKVCFRVFVSHHLHNCVQFRNLRIPGFVFAATDKKLISSTSGFDLKRVMNIRRLRSEMCSFDGLLMQVVCAGKMPTFPKVEAGKDYYFCTCGRSKNQPW